MVGRQKHKFFSTIKTRVLNKIKGWPSQLFSRGGKEILLKAIVQAIPTYAMSVFRLPKGLCEDLQRQITNYWWGSSNRSRGIHLDIVISFTVNWPVNPRMCGKAYSGDVRSLKRVLDGRLVTANQYG